MDINILNNLQFLCKKKKNKLISTYYSSAFFLVLGESIKYFINIPNLITITIGVIQSYNSYYLVTLELPVFILYSFILLILLINIYRSSIIGNFIISSFICNIILLLSNTNYIAFSIYRGNFINIIISIFCYILHVSIELNKFYRFHSQDNINNNLPIKIFNGYQYLTKKAEDIDINDRILIDYGTITPCDILVEKVECKSVDNIDQHEINDYTIGTFYNKENTGENISKTFVSGDILLTHKLITRPNVTIYGKIHKLIQNTYNRSKPYTLRPKLLDEIRIYGDLHGIFYILLLSIIGELYAKYYINSYEPWKYFISYFITCNIFIPSMRMNLFYQIYNILIKIIYSNIIVLNFNGIQRISEIKNFTFDKTGTLTHENLKVFNLYFPPDYSYLQTLEKKIKWSRNEILFAIIMANNQSNFNKNEAWGISPEEVEILKYMDIKFKVTYLFNPLKKHGVFKFSINNSRIRTFRILSRSNYIFGQGKIAVIKFDNLEIKIRQDGSHFFYNQINKKTLNWCKEIEKKDSKRTISIGVYVKNKWFLIGYFTFENRLRDNVKDLYKYLHKNDCNTNILTGDGRETSETIGINIGLSKNLYRISDDQSLYLFSNLEFNMDKTISIDGKYLEKKFKDDDIDIITKILNQPKKDMIIYKASKLCKKYVSKCISNGVYLGDALNDSLAIQEAHVSLCMEHGAHICKSHCDIIIKTPYDIIDILGSIGIRNLVHIGSKKIYIDICWMSGLIGGFLVIGIIKNNFKLLNNSYIFEDSWNPLSMLFISSFQYFISLVAYTFNNCYNKEVELWVDKSIIKYPITIYYQTIGFFLGLLLGSIIYFYLGNLQWSYYSLNTIDIIILVNHTTLLNKRESKNKSNIHNKYGELISFFDSYIFRIFLYLIFYFYITYISSILQI